MNNNPRFPVSHTPEIRRRRLTVFVAVAIAGILLLLGVVYLWSKGSESTSRPTVKIGYLPIYVDLPLFVAHDRGFFSKHGLDVELVRFAASPDIGTGLSTGSIDVGASIAFSVVLSSEARDPGNLKIFIVDSEDEQNYLSSFVVLPTSGITSVSDLRGKKLGVFPGPTAVTFCTLVLEKYGLHAGRDLELIELQAGSHIPALRAGTVDALFTYEPIGTQAVMDIGAKKLLAGAVESEIISPWQAGVWVLRSDFVREQPDASQAVLRALYEAIDFIRSNPDSAKVALRSFTSIRPEVAAATPTIPFAKLGEVDLGALQRHADILTQRGIVSKRLDVDSLLLRQSGVGATAPTNKGTQ